MKKIVLIGLYFVGLQTAFSEEMKVIGVKQSSGLVQEVYPVNPVLKGGKSIAFRPIGYFHSKYTPATGAPRQGVLVPESEAIIQLDEVYRKGLADLEKFEYIIVLYWFNVVETWSPIVNPPKSEHFFGLFATRSPKRPNPIGFSVVRLDSVDKEQGILYLSGIDAFDGTPVLDIKPYLPSIDIVQTDVNKATEKKLGHHNQKYIKDPTMFK